jgi:hypothetical protein
MIALILFLSTIKPQDMGPVEILDKNCSIVDAGHIMYLNGSEFGISRTCTGAISEAKRAKHFILLYRS